MHEIYDRSYTVLFSKLITQELKKLRDTAANEQALSVFFNWFTQLFLHDRIDDADYSKLEKVYHNKEELSMLLEAFQKEKRQLRASGKKEGKREGKRDGKREVAKTMLESGLSLTQIARYTGLDKATLLKMQKARQN